MSNANKDSELYEGSIFWPFITVIIFLLWVGYSANIVDEINKKKEVIEGHKAFEGIDASGSPFGMVEHIDNKTFLVKTFDQDEEPYDPEGFQIYIHWKFNDESPGEVFMFSLITVIVKNGQTVLTGGGARFNLEVEQRSTGVFELTYENETRPVVRLHVRGKE